MTTKQRLTIKSVNNPLSFKNLKLYRHPGKGYSVVSETTQATLYPQFKTLDQVVKAYALKEPAKRLEDAPGIDKAVKHANRLIKLSSASVKQQLMELDWSFMFSKKEFEAFMIEVEQREATLREADEIVDRCFPTNGKRNLDFHGKNNKTAKELFRQLREDFKVDLAGQMFLSR